MDQPYRLRDELPQGTLEAANHLDTAGRDLPDDDWLPAATDTRWQAAARLLFDLEKRRGLDTVRVLLAVAAEPNLETDDIERALQREAKLIRANGSDDHRGGRPSKVEKLTRSIKSSISVADRDGYEGAKDQQAARDNRIEHTLRAADISRSTYYRLRDQVEAEHGIDLTEIAPPSDMVF
jgi:hypothetical protein